MLLYQQMAASATLWPEPMELIWQMQSADLTGSTITVTENRLKRTILTLLLPGGVTLRPMQDCLTVALDAPRSPSFLSQFINKAGHRAGEILEGIDYSPLGDIILARDETYFDDLVFLIGVEPRTYVLLAGQVEESCDGETWD
jgi:hypothetical protein